MKKITKLTTLIFSFVFIITLAFVGFVTRHQASLHASEPTVIYVKDGGSGTKSGTSAQNATDTITSAIKMIGDNDGVIVLCGEVNIAEYSEPIHKGHITITSLYNGTDYRQSSGAVFKLNSKYILGGPVSFENMTVSTDGTTRLFFGNGYPLKFGEGVECNLTVSDGTYPYVFGGNNKKSGAIRGTSVTINSGHFSKVCGGNRYFGGTILGDVSVTINGGTVDTYLAGAGVSQIIGNVSVTVNGGKIGYGVYGADSLPDRTMNLDGNITLNINGGDLAGTIAAVRHDAYASINGSFTCYVNTPELDSVAELRGTAHVGGTNTSRIIYADNVDTAKIKNTTVTYQNPVTTGADPWVIYHEGYYYMAIVRGASITIAKALTVAELGRADPICVWTATADTGVDDSIWSPELHYFSADDFGEEHAGWYLYFACPDIDHPDDNMYRRCYALKALTDDPQGTWGSPQDNTPNVPMQIKMDADNTNWNIGPSVFRINGNIYMTWTGRIFEYYGVHTQNLNIAKMTSPFTLDLSTHAIICEPTEVWEKYGATYSSTTQKNQPETVEGATAVYGPNGEVWCIYSASHYTNENYALAQLRFKGGDPCNINNWEKASSPIFVHNSEVYGPGHASYTTGHDGKTYFIYHGYLLPNNQGGRYVFIEEYTIDGNNIKLGNGKPQALSSTLTVAKTTTSLESRASGFDEIHLSIPNGVTSIEKGMFVNSEHIVSITIPNSVTSIEAGAFSSYTSLASVHFTGTQEQWNAIEIGSDNAPLVSAEKVFHRIAVLIKGNTCTEAGYAYFECDICGSSENELPALGHDKITHEAKAPTCTEIGYGEYITCSRCDYTSQKGIPALGHSFGNWTVQTEPTIFDCGVKIRVCGVCGHTETQKIEKLSHVQGDIDGDSKLTNADLSLIIRYLCGWDIGEHAQLADVNGDGKENNRDAILLITLLLNASEAVEIPAEPAVTNDKKYYVAYDYDENKQILPSGSPALITNDGLTPTTAITTNTTKGNVWGNGDGADPANGAIYKVVKAGGIIVAVGKCHVGTTGIVPSTDTPILFTAIDGTKNYTSVDANGNAVYRADAPAASGNYANKGQYGMFMVAHHQSITFMGDVIFDNIAILERSSLTADAGGKIIVGSTAKIVIGKNVSYYEMNPNGINQTIFEVSEGGYLYLHSVHAFKYTGNGTIILDRALVDSGVATAQTFEGFGGKIVDENGNVIFESSTSNIKKLCPQNEFLGEDHTCVLDITQSGSWNTVSFESVKYPGTTMKYKVYIPNNFDPEKQYPFFMYLHGGGGSRMDIETEFYIHPSLRNFISETNGDAVVIFPQCLPNCEWPLSEKSRDVLLELIDHLCKHVSIDTQRLYISGHSYGTFATLLLLAEKPNFFAAAFITSYSLSYHNTVLTDEEYTNIAQTPMKMYCGAQDHFGFAEPMQELSEKLKNEYGADVEFTLYDDLGHDGVYTRAGSDLDLIRWMLAQRSK